MGWIIFFVIIGVGFYFYSNSKKTSKFAKNIVGFKVFGDNSFSFDIVGEANYQGYLKQIAGPKTEQRKEHDCIAIVRPEPSNAYDPNAVAVFIDNKQVGYFDKATAKKFQKFLVSKNLDHNSVFAMNALIVGGWKDDESVGHYGVKLDVPMSFSDWELVKIEN